MNVAPGYFHRKIEPKEIPIAVWFPAYLLYLPGNLKSQWQPCICITEEGIEQVFNARMLRLELKWTLHTSWIKERDSLCYWWRWFLYWNSILASTGGYVTDNAGLPVDKIHVGLSCLSRLPIRTGFVSSCLLRSQPHENMCFYVTQ